MRDWIVETAISIYTFLLPFAWLGLIMGLFIFGIGVVPLGILGAFFKLGINDLGVSLCVMLVITLAARFAGAACAASADRYKTTRIPPPHHEKSASDLLGALGHLMEQYPTALLDAARLPASKQKMKEVIKQVWREQPKLRGVLTQAYLHLSQFQDGIGNAVLDCKIPEAAVGATPNPADLEQWIIWSKVSTAEMEILAREWEQFQRSAQ